MKHLTPKLLLLAFAGLLMLASCEYEYYVIPPEPVEPPDTTGHDTTTTVDTISFAQEIIPIFSSKCTVCHSGSTAPDLRESKAYNSLKNGNFVVANEPDNSLLYTSLKTGSMKSYISASELKLIRRWILAGAKND